MKGRGFYAFVGFCLALVAVDAIVHRHVVHPWENVFGFYGWYGFVACVLLVLAAKVLRKLVMRDEEYWDG